MGQVTIYLEQGVEDKMIMSAKSAHLSKSKWVAKLIQEKLANEWPQSIIDSAGSWQGFPSQDEIRTNMGEDIEREQF